MDDDKKREIAELKARLEALSSEESPAPVTPEKEKTGLPMGSETVANSVFVNGKVMTWGNAVVAFGLLLVIGAFASQQISSNKSSTQAEVNSSSSNDNSMASTATETAPAPATRWVYSDEGRDQMHGTVEKTACISSTSLVSLSFPYHPQPLELCFRHSHYSGNAYLQLPDGGQFYCLGADGCSIEMRFDKGKIQRFGATEAANGVTGTLFVNSSSRLVAQVKRAKNITMEISFYGNGDQQIVFEDVGGLTW